MKTDTQHLDFLISQYVDGSLDTASRKSMEQRLLTDPESRKLYTDHREVQDLLDDWGNRIPLINWDDFDNKLASRLEKETVGGNSPWLFRRWMRPVAAAAALFLAASVGYNWHDWWGPRSPGNVAAQVAPVDQAPVTEASIAEPVDSPRPSIARFRVDDAPDLQSRPLDRNAVAVNPPGDSFAVESLKQAVGLGMNFDQQMQPEQLGPINRTWAVGVPDQKKQKDRNTRDNEMDLSFP